MKTIYVTVISFLSALLASIERELLVINLLIICYVVTGLWARIKTGDKSIITFKDWMTKLILYPLSIATMKAVEGQYPIIPFEYMWTLVICSYELILMSGNIGKAVGYDLKTLFKKKLSKYINIKNPDQDDQG